MLAFRPFEALPVLPEIKVAHNHEPYHTVGAHGTIQGPTLRLLVIQSESLHWWDPRARKTFSCPLLHGKIAQAHKGSPICVAGPTPMPGS